MKKMNIGLDIGISSVGWSIVGEDYNIIDAGVRLFDDVSDPKTGKLKNEKRRESRSLRRMIRRTRNRKDDLINFFIEKNIIKDPDDFYEKINKSFSNFDVSTMSELKEKMLKEKLNNSALVLVLFNYMHNRGYFYKENENDSKEKNSENVDKTKNKFVKTNEFPSIQLNNFYKKYGFYKGSELSRDFSNSEWKNEIIHLLKTQKKDENFINEYMELFTRFRKYSEGPGSEKSPSEYGLWKIDPKTNKVFKDGDNLWEKTIGKCTIYPELIRGMKSSPFAEVFNILNDINNIHFDKKREKLTKEEKIKLFNKFSLDLEGKKISSISSKSIAKTLDLNLEDISGWVDEKKVSLKNYILIAKWLIQNKIYNGEKNLLNIDLLNQCNDIFNDLTKIKDVKEQAEKLSKDFPMASKDSTDELLKKISGLSATHSLSYKAMLEYINIGIKESINQMEVFSDKILENRKSKNNFLGKYIPRNLFEEEIISPTTRRSFNQSVAVINKIIKYYGDKYEIGYITIELARDKNSAEQRKNISKIQKRNKESLENVLKRENIDYDSLSNIQKIKIKLWEEQDRTDIYDGQEITIEDVKNNKNLDIDHIIPYSISMDNSLSNKVLSKSKNNKEKTNLSPYNWLSSQGKYEDFKQRVESIYVDKKKYKKKIQNLLFEGDPITDISDFIGRNLVDTRYASKLLLETLKLFFQNSKTIINVINGSVTNYCRYKVFELPKDREEYEHHAYDALIVSFLGMNHSISKIARLENMYKYEKKDDFQIVLNETGEVINLKNQFEIDNNSIHFKEELDNIKDKIKFSRMVLKNKNISLSNETIRGFRKVGDENKIIQKIDIVNSSPKELNAYFNKEKLDDKKLEDLLIYLKDKYIYDCLFEIYNKYYQDDKKNPFISYMEDNFANEAPFTKIRIGNQHIKNLKKYGDAKTFDNVILLKNHNDNAFLETLTIKSLRIYKNNKDKYVLIAINAKVLKSIKNNLVIDKEELNIKLSEKSIIDKKFIEIKKGTIIIDKNNNQIFYSNGGGSIGENRLEFKPINCSMSSFFSKTNSSKKIKRVFLSLSTLVENYFLADIDVLGNIYNKRKIEIN